MPEARIRVAALHLAGARALPLLCLGIGGGLQSRLVHHARSALKQQKSSSAPRAAPANASLRLPSSQQLALRQVASKSRSTHRRRRQKRRTNPCKYSIRYRTRQKISVYGQTLAKPGGHGFGPRRRQTALRWAALQSAACSAIPSSRAAGFSPTR